MDAISLSFVFLPSVEFLGMVATGIVLLAGGMAVINQTLTIGVMVAFLAYVTRFFQPIQELSQLYTTLQAAMAGGERVLELLDTVPSVPDPPDGASSGARSVTRADRRVAQSPSRRPPVSTDVGFSAQ